MCNSSIGEPHGQVSHNNEIRGFDTLVKKSAALAAVISVFYGKEGLPRIGGDLDEMSIDFCWLSIRLRCDESLLGSGTVAGCLGKGDWYNAAVACIWRCQLG